MLRLSDSRPSTNPSQSVRSFLDHLIPDPLHRRAAVLSILLTACPPSSGDTETTNETTVNPSITTNNNPTGTDSDTVTTGFTTNANDTVVMGSTSMPEPETTTMSNPTEDATTVIPCEGAPKYGECDMPNQKDPKCNGGSCSNCTEECLCAKGTQTYEEDEEPCLSCDRDNGYIQKGTNPDGTPICEIYVPKPPTVNRMPKEGEVMAIFEECYVISGTCEPVDHIITSDSLDGPWININLLDPEQCGVNPNQNAYVKNTNTWTVTKAAPLGLSMDCFETVKYGLTSDPVCFEVVRLE